MDKTVLGVFSAREDAEEALRELQRAGYNPKDISIVMRDRTEREELARNTGTDVADGAVSGAATGAVIGGLAGLLAATIIPGLGAFFIGGPIAVALGLTGAAASTASGAVTGAAAGGLIGALMGLGLGRNEAEEYQEAVKQGGILVAVPTSAEDTEVQEILEENDADQIKAVSNQPQEDLEGETATLEPMEDTDELDEIYMDEGAIEFSPDSNFEEDIRDSNRYADNHAYAQAGVKGGESSTPKKTTHRKKSTAHSVKSTRSKARKHSAE